MAGNKEGQQGRVRGFLHEFESFVRNIANGEKLVEEISLNMVVWRHLD